ncbi:hypothetical protein SULI_12680 [Saccharolobus solfataricus]|uniref:Plasmid stabilization system n=3 Tax=Saccharolobus solfataricus TaxID=2287 RepID=Q97XM3_SACS2|nr:hypothetical protein [Saccharolobus solfataricus]AAK41900.1 Hypothetical protein SSO1690 [Saccharolobus solfataricus P2]AKA74630.1 hypothetical protein SULB_2501 [Saccharolobus solfataricus]AKA77324.1 hypothetical protein SULC_2496 [Saccharolobus solfataricus]AKA80015.1 hypothetical protein SULA_2498 [Saccharolobus solfataricus]AZF69097.1 hypothetical protein SULG_12680 [Saccharolobus solfataricus]
MLTLSAHLRKHLEDINNYLKKFNNTIDPLSDNVLSFLANLKGTPQVPNKILGESERWRVSFFILNPVQKIRYVIAKRGEELILVTAHPDPDADKFVEFQG